MPVTRRLRALSVSQVIDCLAKGKPSARMQKPSANAETFAKVQRLTSTMHPCTSLSAELARLSLACIIAGLQQLLQVTPL